MNKLLNFCIGAPRTAVRDITIIPLSNDSLIVNWIISETCVHNYTVTINGNHSRSSLTPSIKIDALTIGSHYSIIIIPIDTIGREGLPSSLIQFVWNGKYYTQ